MKGCQSERPMSAGLMVHETLDVVMVIMSTAAADNRHCNLSQRECTAL